MNIANKSHFFIKTTIFFKSFREDAFLTNGKLNVKSEYKFYFQSR